MYTKIVVADVLDGELNEGFWYKVYRVKALNRNTGNSEKVGILVLNVQQITLPWQEILVAGILCQES